MSTLEEIGNALRSDHECPLGTPGQVIGEGPAGARVMFVGEAPGADEVRQGRPLVGRAGRVFDGLLELMGLRRDDVFITNLLKCRPPDNRAPRAAEVRACLPFLLQQIAAVDPAVIVPMGGHALKALAGADFKLAEVHGRPLPYGDRVLFPLFHPAAGFYRDELRAQQKTDAAALGEFLRRQPSAISSCSPGGRGDRPIG